MDENDVYPNYVNLDTDTLTSENKELKYLENDKNDF